jgi:hypothetical protein
MGKDRVEQGPRVGQEATLCPKKFWIFPIIPLYITQFIPTPDFGNLETKFRKENFGKGKP